jgi:uncharacterized protein
VSADLYEGWVRHRRFGAVPHSFRYRLYMTLSGGRRRTLQMPRSLGVGFNPVRFHFDMDGDEVASLAAEVTNTPWGERHAYVLRAGDGPVLRGDTDKRLHVSPFLGMDHRYAWRATAPGATLSVHIECGEGAARPFDATLSLDRRPLTARSLVALAGGSLRTLALIYAHAARLGLARVPVHPHPAESAS